MIDERRQREQEHARIRRGNEHPPFIRDEKRERRSYPYSLPDSGSSGTCLTYRKSRWSWLGDEPGGVKRREIFGWIKAGQKRVGAIQLFEYDLAFSMDNDSFRDLMDAESQIEYELAEVLCASWEWFGDAVTDYGSLLDFRMAWMDPTFDRHGVWWAAAKKLIAHEFPHHALLTMKAFPLEYEGRAPEGARSERGLLSRQNAMVRYYKQQFGVNEFPAPFGKDGWLYKISDHVAETVDPPMNAQTPYAERT